MNLQCPHKHKRSGAVPKFPSREERADMSKANDLQPALEYSASSSALFITFQLASFEMVES